MTLRKSPLNGQDKQPDFTYRKLGHDYFKPAIYHIILKKLNTAPLFCRIIGNPAIPPEMPGGANVNYFKMGYAISNSLKDFEKKYPEFQTFHYKIMPDHVHWILFKKMRTPIHLEDYMEWFKEIVAEKYVEERQGYLHHDEIFQESFVDKVLIDQINLNTWFVYLDHNPHRRLMIEKRPYFFQRIRNLKIDDQTFEAYGNLFLFRNPDKYAVRMRRSFSTEQRMQHEEEALQMVKEHSILVSPFISPIEKNLREKAENLGAQIILIQHEKFPEQFKPSKHDFQLCTTGRLLIISLGLPIGTPISYQISTQMNELAALICAMSLRKQEEQK